MKKNILTYTLFTTIYLVSTYPSITLAEVKPSIENRRSATNQLDYQLINKVINKSPTDNAVYQGIKLNNGIEVLLISDKNANKSLMSVGLPVGSMEDPILQQGLAHYLEHMILMGSKKYPQTNSLDNFLTKNGGYNNAYTAPDKTVYYLEVNHQAFSEAVDRLSDTFAQPLLSEKNAKKEIDAVNAEMVRAKSSDGFLIQDVNLATSNPQHPRTKFAVGNHVTLSDKPESKLQDELRKFYDDYYSANLMKAVLYSNLSIDELAKLATNTLGKIENKQISEPKVNVPFLRKEDKGIWINYKPVKPTKMLVLSFDYPEDKQAFKHKTGRYLSYLFSNNTDGTLSDYLIKNGLSNSGVEIDYTPDISRDRGDFSFYIELTDKGLKEKDKIISLVFQQVKKISQEGIKQSYFDELKENARQDFEHLQVEKNGNYIAYLVSQMLEYPIEHIIDQPYTISNIDKKAILDKLSGMTVDNLRVILIDENAKTDKKTQYFEAPYSVQNITQEQKQKWLDFSSNPEIKLPELNPYFAKDFSLISINEKRQKPAFIKQEKGTEIYAMPSYYFSNEPKAEVDIRFINLPENNELKPKISAALLGYMNELSQAKLMFQTSVAGMKADLSTEDNGITLSVNGYTQNIGKLLQDMIAGFSQFEITPEILLQAKQRFLEKLDKDEKENALRQANFAISNFSTYPYFEIDKKRETINQITIDDIKNTRQNLLNNATYLKGISVGNLSDEQVISITENLSKLVRNSNKNKGYGRYIDINNSQRKINYIKSISHEDNGFVISFFPNYYGEFEGLSRAILLRSIISRWYFDDLRTDKQLGYVVYANNTQIGKTSGIQFSVQSPTVSAASIMEHNQRFFDETLHKLVNLPEKEFEQYRTSLLEILQYKPESLSEEFSDFMLDYLRGNHSFDRKQKLIEHIKKLTKDEVIIFYKNAVIDKNSFIFASQTIGTNKTINQPAQLKGFEQINSIEALQKEFSIKHYD